MKGKKGNIYLQHKHEIKKTKKKRVLKQFSFNDQFLGGFLFGIWIHYVSIFRSESELSKLIYP